MKRFNFKWAMLIYVTILAVVIAIASISVWNGLEKYQNAYNEAETSGNPELLIKELTDKWGYDEVLGYVKEFGVTNISEYNTPEQIAGYFTGLQGDITYTKNEKYTEVMPVYDICAGDTRIAVVSFKSDGNNDEFGFHKWQIRELVFDTDSAHTEEYSLCMLRNYSVTINGKTLTEDNVQEGGCTISSITNPVALKAQELSGVVIEYVTYDLGTCLVRPEIKVTDSQGNEVLYFTEEDGEINYTLTVGDDFIACVEQRVLDTCNSYIMNIYNKLSFYQMSGYLLNNSEAYAVVKDVQASIIWGWHPDTVEVLEESVSDYVKYSDTLFSCKYYGKIYKADETEEEEEIFNYHLLFHNNGEEWYLTYFVLE